MESKYLLLVTAAFVLFSAGILAIRSRRDPVTLLTVFAVLLFLVPARLVLPGLGGIGTPANIVALGLLGWWMAACLVPSLGLPRTPQPVRYGLFVYTGWMLLSYALAYLRPLSDLEVSGADRSLIGLAAVLGVALIGADGILSIERLMVLLRRIVLLATIVASIGILQFRFQYDPVPLLQPPGLVQNSEIFAFKGRSIFNRPYSTTLHPIEFSVVLAIVFPLALHFALAGSKQAGSVLRWSCAVIIAAATLMSVSRSGVLGIILAVVVLSWGWSWRRRLNVLIAVVLFAGLMRAAIPGLVGTIRNLFLGAADDPSIQGRIDDIAGVQRLLMEAPLVGRGLGTWNSEEYFVLDNEYYRTALEAGPFGVLTLLVLLGTAGFSAWRVARHAESEIVRHLAQALLASLVVCTVTMATFDGLAYPMFTGLLFLLIGASGALWRLERIQAPDRERSPDLSPVGR